MGQSSDCLICAFSVVFQRHFAMYSQAHLQLEPMPSVCVRGRSNDHVFGRAIGQQQKSLPVYLDSVA